MDKIQRVAHKTKGRIGPPPSLSDFQQYIRTRGVESLGFRMGEIYMNAVKFCLDARSDDKSVHPDVEVEGQLVDGFNKEVVAELARCVV